MFLRSADLELAETIGRGVNSVLKAFLRRHVSKIKLMSTETRDRLFFAQNSSENFIETRKEGSTVRLMAAVSTLPGYIVHVFCPRYHTLL
jgi:hypothetical protein